MPPQMKDTATMRGDGMFDGLHPLLVAAAIFPLGALAGLAMLVRSEREITPRELIAATLTSALFSACVFLIGHAKLGGEAMSYLVGVSILAGFGTNTLLGAAIKSLESVVKKFAGSEPK